MKITRSSADTQKGPAEWFTGDVYIDAAAPEATSTFAAASVHFTPGARTAWHTHPHGQTMFVIVVQQNDEAAPSSGAST
jgi:quercetin dioxygenase-like cupin family protein